MKDIVTDIDKWKIAMTFFLTRGLMGYILVLSGKYLAVCSFIWESLMRWPNQRVLS